MKSKTKKSQPKYIVQVSNLTDLIVFNDENSAKEYLKELEAKGRVGQLYIDQIGDLSNITEA
jgi:hypothetical protein